MRKNMKQLVALSMSAAMVLTACSTSSKPAETKAPETEVATEDETEAAETEAAEPEVYNST